MGALLLSSARFSCIAGATDHVLGGEGKARSSSAGGHDDLHQASPSCSTQSVNHSQLMRVASERDSDAIGGVVPQPVPAHEAMQRGPVQAQDVGERDEVGVAVQKAPQGGLCRLRRQVDRGDATDRGRAGRVLLLVMGALRCEDEARPPCRRQVSCGAPKCRRRPATSERTRWAGAPVVPEPCWRQASLNDGRHGPIGSWKASDCCRGRARSPFLSAWGDASVGC